MLCPVCKTECGENVICKECGFSEVGKTFINQEDAEQWLNTVATPYKENYDQSNILQPINWVELFCQNPKVNALFNVTIPAVRIKRAESTMVQVGIPDYNDLTEQEKNATINEIPGHIAVIFKSESIHKHFFEELEKTMVFSGYRQVILNGSIKMGDLTAVLTNVSAGDAVVFEVANGIKSEIWGFLSRICEDYSFDVPIGKGSSARSFRIEVPPFTAVFAIKNINDMQGQLLEKVDSVIELNYSDEELLEFRIRELAATFDVKLSKVTLSVLKEKASKDNCRSLLKFISDYLYLHKEFHQPLNEEAMRHIINIFC